MALVGNTPTCVGKTRRPEDTPAAAKKHPHVRGEDTLEEHDKTMEWETPPRAWGRPKRASALWQERRNTPTCVGKTRAMQWVRCAWWKHPHVRGEDKLRRA